MLLTHTSFCFPFKIRLGFFALLSILGAIDLFIQPISRIRCKNMNIPCSYKDVAEGSRHSIGVTLEGVAFSWGRSNSLGQLGRIHGDTSSPRVPGQVPLSAKAERAFASVGSTSDSGHSAILDAEGRLWMAGCDRWQQLGLGSSNAGSTGYTWKDGKLWQETFTLSHFVTDLMKEIENSSNIRDVSLGGDHTLVLSSSKKDVYSFGKGAEGQLGWIAGKPFVSAPRRSPVLSEPGVAAVCAIQACSITLDDHGMVKQQVGRCRASVISESLGKCVDRARKLGLLCQNDEPLGT